jgi:hypothetical protein
MKWVSLFLLMSALGGIVHGFAMPQPASPEASLAQTIRWLKGRLSYDVIVDGKEYSSSFALERPCVVKVTQTSPADPRVGKIETLTYTIPLRAINPDRVWVSFTSEPQPGKPRSGRIDITVTSQEDFIGVADLVDGKEFSIPCDSPACPAVPGPQQSEVAIDIYDNDINHSANLGQRVHAAFRHAVTLCGGEGEPF